MEKDFQRLSHRISAVSVRFSVAPLCKEEIDVDFRQRSVTSSKTHKEDRVRAIANGHAIFRLGESAMHLRCPQVCCLRICECSTDEGPRGCVGCESRRVAGGCSGCFDFGVCELVTRDSFVPWYPHKGCRTRLRVVLSGESLETGFHLR